MNTLINSLKNQKQNNNNKINKLFWCLNCMSFNNWFINRMNI